MSRGTRSFARAAWIAAALAAVVGTLLVARSRGWIRFRDPDPTHYPIRGIDVSHHQGSIEWSRVANAQISFVFIKATEGGDFRDPRFTSFWRKAGTTGLARGAYHYFTFCTGGHVQADNFLAAVPPGQRMLPPVVDVEFAGNCNRPPAKEVIREELRQMIARLRKEHGRWPILYVTKDGYEEVAQGTCDACPLWVRAAWGEPVIPEATWTFWQFTDRGEVDGVRGPVDLNVFRGDAKAMEALLRGAD